MFRKLYPPQTLEEARRGWVYALKCAATAVRVEAASEWYAEAAIQEGMVRFFEAKARI